MRGVGILDEMCKLRLVALDSFHLRVLGKCPWQVIKAKGLFLQWGEPGAEGGWSHGTK